MSGSVRDVATPTSSAYTGDRETQCCHDRDVSHPLAAAICDTPDRAVSRGEVAPDSVAGRPAKWTTWRLAEQASSSADISQLINVLHRRIIPIAAELKKLRQAGCDIVFQLALYHSPGDEGSRGFTLDAALLKSLADIGAIVDVDQYILPDE